MRIALFIVVVASAPRIWAAQELVSPEQAPPRTPPAPTRTAYPAPTRTAYIETENLIEHYVATTLSLLSGFYGWEDPAYRPRIEDRFIRHLERLEKMHEEELSTRPLPEGDPLTFMKKAARTRQLQRLKNIADEAMFFYLTGLSHPSEKTHRVSMKRTHTYPTLVEVCASLCKVLGHERRGKAEVILGRKTSRSNWLGEARKFMSYRVKK